MAKLQITMTNGCWLDVFDAEGYRGNSRRLLGPADFPRLRIREKDWGDSIRSLVVGPGSYVQCFTSASFSDTVFWLLPNQSVEEVAQLECAEGIDSIRLFDRPPFAHEPGYAPYMLWAASHLARMDGGTGTPGT